ncbi:ATP-binding protein [Desulforamulus hydrothermalis]|uniref:ATP-binding protein n=1 Tax=Desulforamulus hydrothermalis TaxID=412895 RepID=UPI003B75C79D
MWKPSCKRISVYFVSLSKIIEDLRKAYTENRPDKRLRIYIRPKLLIIDENWLLTV